MLLFAGWVARGAAPDTPPRDGASDGLRFKRLWAWQGDQPLVAAPAWDGAAGWIALMKQGRLIALDALGHPRWDVTATNAVFETRPAVISGRVLAVSRAGVLWAWRVSDGAFLWQIDLQAGPFAHGPTAFMRGAVPAAALMVAGDGRIVCVDIAAGARLWTSDPTQRTDGPPSADGAFLAFGNCDSAIYAVAVGDGSPVARIPVGENSQMAGGVAFAGGRVYGGTRDGRLVCADIVQRRLAWSVQLCDGELFSTPLLAADGVYAATDAGDLVALRPDTGAVLWRRNFGAHMGSPSLSSGALWVVADGRVLAVDPADGREIFSFAAGDRVSDPVAGGGQVAVVDDNGGIIVFGK